MIPDLQLRPVTASDISVFFEHQRDPEATRVAAFTAKDPSDRAAFVAHLEKLSRDDSVVTRTIVFDGRVAGRISKFEQDGRPEVTYWIGREFWGRGIATSALAEFLRQVTVRPLYARAAKDNMGSLRVLTKCGFAVVGEEKGFANARGAEIEESILELRA